MNKIFVYLFSFYLVIAPLYANAGAAEKWEIIENVYDTSKNTVNVTAKKITQDAANSGVYKVQVPVNTSTLGSTAKMMLKGGFAVAAITALVESVGWVIEEGSKIYKIVPPSEPTDPTVQFLFSPTSIVDYIYISPKSALNAQLKIDCKDNASYCNSTITSCGYPIPNTYSGYLTCQVKRPDNFTFDRTVPYIKNPNYDPFAEPEKIPVSDVELGSEIIGTGTNKTPKTDIITDAYSPNNPISEAPAPKETVDALDNANPEPSTPPTGQSTPLPNKDTDGDGKPDTHDPSEPEVGSQFTWPNACEWFPAACEFFKVQKQDNKDIKENQKTDMAQNQSFFEKVSDWFDWTKEEPDNNDEDNSVQVTDVQVPEINTNLFNADGQCPAPFTYDFPLPMGGSHSITYSYDTVCYWFSKLYYIVVSVAWVVAYRIVTGTTGGANQDG